MPLYTILIYTFVHKLNRHGSALKAVYVENRCVMTCMPGGVGWFTNKKAILGNH